MKWNLLIVADWWIELIIYELNYCSILGILLCEKKNGSLVFFYNMDHDQTNRPNQNRTDKNQIVQITATSEKLKGNYTQSCLVWFSSIHIWFELVV